MPGGLAASLAGLGLLGAVQSTPFVAARAEVDAGVAPEAPLKPTEPSLIVDLRPAAGARFATPRSTLDLAILPRLFLQTPNPSRNERPLFMVRTDAFHQYQASPRLWWNSYLGVFAGEVNYTNTELLLDAKLSRNVVQAVVSAVNTEGRTGFAWQTSPVTSLTFSAFGQYTAPLTEASKRTLPQTTAIGFELTNGWEASPVSRFSFPLRARRYFVKGAVADTQTLEAGVSHNLALSARTTFDTSLGLVYSDGDDQDARFLPTGSIGLSRVVYATRAANVTNRISANVTTAYDPTRSEIYPIGGLQVFLGGQVGASWRPYVAVEGYTTLTTKPVSTTQTDSRFSAVAALAYRLSSTLALEGGARCFTWAPNIREHFKFVDYQVFGFMALTFALDLPLGGAPGTILPGAATTMGGMGTGAMGGMGPGLR